MSLLLLLSMSSMMGCNVSDEEVGPTPMEGRSCDRDGARFGDLRCVGGTWTAQPSDAGTQDVDHSPDTPDTPSIGPDADDPLDTSSPPDATDVDFCDDELCLCVGESAYELCAGNQAQCGVLTIDNRCGESVVIDCGDCGNGDVCEQNVCECAPESNAALCAAEGFTCGDTTITDRCGTERSFSCGQCSTDDTCEDNKCGCVGESPEELCAQESGGCGVLTIEDLCGAQREVDCGGCAGAQTCHQGSCCSPRTCEDEGAACGSIDDGCGGTVVCTNTCLATGWYDSTGSTYSCCRDGQSCQCRQEEYRQYLCDDNQCDFTVGAVRESAVTGTCADCTLYSACSIGTCDDGACVLSSHQSCGTGCGGGNICDGTGTCARGCCIGGDFYANGASNPSNACQVCNADSTTSAWSTASIGTACGSNDVCDGSGNCIQGCYINDTLYSPGRENPDNTCQTCDPSSSTSWWSNGPRHGQACAQTSCSLSGLCNCNTSRGTYSCTDYTCDDGQCTGENYSTTADCDPGCDGPNDHCCSTGHCGHCPSQCTSGCFQVERECAAICPL
ncbi:MAG: hypothetical protein ACNA8W_05575 [Bradymonadaceae bacterium]